MANLAPSWRPERLQNRGQHPKKSMLKNDIFLTSIFKGFGRRFGEAFGRFFGPKPYSKSDLKKSARQAKTIVKTNIKSMLAPLQKSIFRAKFNENQHVFWNIDFRGISDRFWRGFGSVWEGFWKGFRSLEGFLARLETLKVFLEGSRLLQRFGDESFDF